eukprot:1128752-Karenia_brevis.AAC.1
MLKSVAWGEKLRAWKRAPASCYMHNAAGFQINQGSLTQAGRWERDKVRKILCLRRQADEGMHGFHQRTQQRINKAFRNAEVEVLHRRLLRTSHRWIKVAVEFCWQADDGGTIYPLRELMSVRLPQNWPFEQAAGLDMDPQNVTGWRHRRPGRFNDWSEHLRTAFGDEWLQFAMSSTRKEWRRSEDGFIEKLSNMWGLTPEMADTDTHGEIVKEAVASEARSNAEGLLLRPQALENRSEPQSAHVGRFSSHQDGDGI